MRRANSRTLIKSFFNSYFIFGTMAGNNIPSTINITSDKTYSTTSGEQEQKSEASSSITNTSPDTSASSQSDVRINKRSLEIPNEEPKTKVKLQSPLKLKRFFSTGIDVDKEYWIKLPLEEKRKHYKCGQNYITLNDIPTWPEFYKKTKCKPPNEKFRVQQNPALNSKVSLWQGDITRLEIDAIVNAANSSLMGGGGVDGAIHSAAGVSLKSECRELNGCDTGDAKLTTGHRLPAKYIIHTVGPMDSNSDDLKSCYEKCLQIVLREKIRSVAFCCIATGVYGFPNESAAEIALETVRQWLDHHADKVDRIIFTVFLKIDYKIYSSLLQIFFPLEEKEFDSDNVEKIGNDDFDSSFEDVIPKLQKYETEPYNYSLRGPITELGLSRDKDSDQKELPSVTDSKEHTEDINMDQEINDEETKVKTIPVEPADKS